MIRPLRQRHRLVFTVLAGLLPLALVAGLAVRKPVLAGNSPTSDSLTPPLWTRDHLFTNAPVTVRLSSAAPGRPMLTLTAPPEFLKPDLLVYWQAGETVPVDSLPDNATLLGQFSSPQLPLPGSAATQSGRLVLYSLADNEIVAVSQPFRGGPSAP